MRRAGRKALAIDNPLPIKKGLHLIMQYKPLGWEAYCNGSSGSRSRWQEWGFAQKLLHKITPPLEHLLSLLCELSNNVHGPNPHCLMTQSLFNRVSVESVLCQQRCACPT